MAIEKITKFSDAIQPADIINEVVDVVNNADLEEFVGASESQAGKKGIVPAPEAGSEDRYLSSDGTWKQVTMPTIASKEDAQTGTDNTKMMTPLRTIEAIKKQRPLITFTSFSQMDLPNTLTWLDFINKIKELAYSNWELITWVSNDEDDGYPNLELPYEYGGFLFVRGSATGSFVAQLSNHNNNDLYITSCVGSENKINSWTKISNLTDYLPLTGGVMKGSIQSPVPIIVSSGGSPALVAENVDNEYGSQLYMFKSDHSEYKGGFVLRTQSSSGGGYDLTGKSDGTLTWGNKNIVTSANLNVNNGVATLNSSGHLTFPNGSEIWVE